MAAAAALGVVALLAAAAVGYAVVVHTDIAGADVSSVPNMKESTKVYDASGNLIYEFFERKRTAVPLSRISPHIVSAVLAIEDRRFYRHHGFDVRSMVRAAVANLRSARVAQGASTITQQLARNAFLTQEKSYRRKLEEILLALKIEHRYTKDQILEFYLNRVGSGYYGMETAARGYFGKSAADVSVDEAALLAGLIKAPAGYSPVKFPKRALDRRNTVLAAMVDGGRIAKAESERAQGTPLRIARQEDSLPDSNYAIDYVRDRLLEMFGYEKTFNGGLRVYTTIDPKMQGAAEAAVESTLAKIEKRAAPAGSSRANYLKRRAAGEEAAPDYLQGAVLSMNVRTGEICAMVGGRSYSDSKFNRATQAKRQPGSAFKPIVYAAALQTGMSPATLVQSEAGAYQTEQGLYVPANSDDQSYGRVSLRTALRKSINTTAVRVGQEVGLERIVGLARRFEISGPLPPVVSLPLGTAELTLQELVRAYSAFPGQGTLAEPTILRQVVDRNGKVVYAAAASTHRALDPQTAFLMTSMLADVVDRGTAYPIRASGYKGAVAGKTGTTDDFHDAWFVGFTRQVVTGVWVGYDSPRPIMDGGFGAELAVPIWTKFMKACFPNPPVTFKVPDGIVRAAVCAQTGQRATPGCTSTVLSPEGEAVAYSNVYTEYFSQQNLPAKCTVHSALSYNSTAPPYGQGQAWNSYGTASAGTAARH